MWQLESDNRVIYEPRRKGKKAVRAITEICNIHICLEIKQKSLITLFLVIGTSLLWADCILVASTNKDTGSTEVLKMNYLGIVSNCLDKIEHSYADFVNCIFCVNNLAFLRICSLLYKRI